MRCATLVAHFYLPGVLWFDSRILFHFSSPLQEVQQIRSFAPHEAEKLEETYVVHLDASVGLDPPAQVGTLPRREVMAAGSIPKEADYVPHGTSIRQKFGAIRDRISSSGDGSYGNSA